MPLDRRARGFSMTETMFQQHLRKYIVDIASKWALIVILQLGLYIWHHRWQGQWGSLLLGSLALAVLIESFTAGMSWFGKWRWRVWMEARKKARHQL